MPAAPSELCLSRHEELLHPPHTSESALNSNLLRTRSNNRKIRAPKEAPVQQPKTVELSKATFEGSKNIAQSDDTKRVLQSVAQTPSAVGSWFEKDAKAWINNVAARATGGTSVDNDGFPTAKMWVDPPPARGGRRRRKR